MTRDAAWWREYRRTHRAQIAARRSALWRRPERVAARAADVAQRATVRGVLANLPALHHGHPLFDLARSVVRDGNPLSELKSWVEVALEDARSEAVVAALEGRDPKRAAGDVLRREAEWHRITTVLGAAVDWQRPITTVLAAA